MGIPLSPFVSNALRLSSFVAGGESRINYFFSAGFKYSKVYALAIEVIRNALEC